MKKIIGAIVGILVIVMVLLLGYKFVYRVSPREYITKDTRFIYANEGVWEKDFSVLKTLLPEEEQKDFEENVKNLKYISNIYLFSNKEFYDINEDNMVGIVDVGCMYPLAMLKLKNYVDYDKNGIYKLKEEAKEKYIGDFQEELYMMPYRGLFFISLNPSNLEEFSKSRRNYIFVKEIENYLDENRDNVSGAVIYNNTGNDFYGINYIQATSKIEGEEIVADQTIVLDSNAKDRFQPYTKEKELLPYIEEGDIYLSLEDFSKIEDLIFNPYVIGNGVDSKTFINMWKSMLRIDLDEIFKEIDGEAILRINDREVSGLFKMKENFDETKKLLNFLNNKDSLFTVRIDNNIKEERLLVIGRDGFKKQEKITTLPKGSFIFGDINIPASMDIPELRVNILGQENKIDVKITTKIEELIKTKLK